MLDPLLYMLKRQGRQVDEARMLGGLRTLQYS